MRVGERLATDSLRKRGGYPDSQFCGAAANFHPSVTEKFTLGKGISQINGTMWTPATVSCFRQQAPAKILAFAVNNAIDDQ